MTKFVINLLILFLFNYRRKWLPPPLRKLSQGKVDKTSNVAERPLVKKGSEKTFKLATNTDKLTISTTEDDANLTLKSIPTTSTTSSITNQSNNISVQQKMDANLQQQQPQDLEGEEEATFELPPPMKPIQDAQSIINNGATATSASSTSATVVEQSPCKRVRFQ